MAAPHATHQLQRQHTPRLSTLAPPALAELSRLAVVFLASDVLLWSARRHPVRRGAVFHTELQNYRTTLSLDAPRRFTHG